VRQAWVLLGSALYGVPLRIPRRFYVNAALEPEDAATMLGLSSRVSRTLPGPHPPGHVYEVVMDEADFRAQHSALATQLSCSAVGGTYEDRIPLDLQATLAVGCCAGVSGRDAKGRALSRRFSLEELAMKVPCVVESQTPPVNSICRKNTHLFAFLDVCVKSKKLIAFTNTFLPWFRSLRKRWISSALFVLRIQ
jgi:hypothetical protein